MRQRTCCDGECFQKPGPGTCPAFDADTATQRPLQKTRAGIAIGGAYIPKRDTAYAEPIRRYRARSFFARFVAWLRS